MKRDSLLWRIVHLEPTLLRGGVVAVVALAGLFGIFLPGGLDSTAVAIWVPLMAIVQAVWTRSAVVPEAKAAVVVPDPVNAPDTVAAGEARPEATDRAILAAARSAPEA